MLDSKNIQSALTIRRRKENSKSKILDAIEQAMAAAYKKITARKGKLFEPSLI